MKNPSCRVQDAGLFVGLLTAPPGLERSFYEENVKEGLFDTYKNRVKDNFTKTDAEFNNAYNEYLKYFYRPQAYSIFGSFDIAVLSLIDDYEFAARTFGPYDPMSTRDTNPEKYIPQFSHQIIFGPIAKFGSGKNAPEVAKESFLSESEKELPLIAISQFKINSGCFIGAGFDFLRFAIRSIRSKFEAFESAFGQLQILISQSYGWNEITMVVLGQSYIDIGNLLLSIREMSIRDIEVELKKLEKQGKLKSKELDFFYEALDHTLAAMIARKKEKSASKSSVYNNHVFDNTSTIVGFRIEIIDEVLSKDSQKSVLLDRISIDDTISPQTKWISKAGHLNFAIKEVSAMNGGRVIASFGKGDFIYPLEDWISTKEFIRNFIELKNEIKNSRHLINTHTTINLNLDCLSNFSEDAHIYFSKDVTDSLRIKLIEIRKLNDALIKHGVPKTVTERIINLFSNFNLGICDPILFGYFLELHPLIVWLLRKIRDWETNNKNDLSVEKISDKLSKIVDDFDIAFKNRYYAGCRMNEISDFNLEFKGGIQQLVSAYDTAFKIMALHSGDEGKVSHAFAIIGGSPRVSSTEYALALNFHHIFQPEYFISILGHEIANFKLKTSNAFGDVAPSVEAIGDFVFAENENASKLERVLRLYTNQEFFKYITADLIAYHTTFCCDVELFVFWYFANWYTSPRTHSSSNVIEETSFIAILMRISSVVYLCTKLSFDSVKITKPVLENKELRELIEKWNNETHDYIVNLWQFDSINRWAENKKHLIKNEILSIQTKDKYTSISDLNSDTIRRAQDFAPDLAEGKPIRADKGFTGKGMSSYYNHTRSLLYSLLYWIYGKCECTDSFLIRSKEDGKTLIDNSVLSPFLFDKRGGTFTHDPVTRRQYFQYRAALVLSIIDLSTVVKKEIINNNT